MKKITMICDRCSREYDNADLEHHLDGHLVPIRKYWEEMKSLWKVKTGNLMTYKARFIARGNTIDDWDNEVVKSANKEFNLCGVCTYAALLFISGKKKIVGEQKLKEDWNK